jgi:hypothetical protein
MTQGKTAAGNTLGVLLRSECCVFVCVCVMCWMWWWNRTHMNRVSAWPVSSGSSLSGSETEHTWIGLVREIYGHAEDCLAAWLPTSCNAAPLIAKATTQHKEVAFRQHIRRYQILCCYRVSRPGLLNGLKLRELVRVVREIWQLCQTWQLIFLYNQHLTSVACWKLTAILFCLSYWREKLALVRVVQSGTGQSTLRL